MLNFKGFKIYLTYGAKGSGKSLTQAKDALDIFASYDATDKKYPDLSKRIYFGNQKFNEEIEKKYLGKRLYYWTNAKQLRWCPRTDCWKGKELHPVHDTDIAHDEISKDLPAGSWADTPKWFRQIFSHLRKRGNRYFANTQVYEDIDIAFRRQIDVAYKIKKIWGSGDITASLPVPEHYWFFFPFPCGIISRKEFPPSLLEWERDPEKREIKSGDFEGQSELIFIRKRYVEAYDTKGEIPAYKPDTLEHVDLWCENDNCEKHGRNNPDAKPKVEHYKI